MIDTKVLDAEVMSTVVSRCAVGEGLLRSEKLCGGSRAVIGSLGNAEEVRRDLGPRQAS